MAAHDAQQGLSQPRSTPVDRGPTDRTKGPEIDAQRRNLGGWGILHHDGSVTHPWNGPTAEHHARAALSEGRSLNHIPTWPGLARRRDDDTWVEHVEDWPLGTRVRFVASLERRAEYRRNDRYHQRYKKWVVVPGRRPTSGVLVGVRTLANGETMHDYEAGTYWLGGSATYFPALLIAHDLRRKPILALPRHVERAR